MCHGPEPGLPRVRSGEGHVIRAQPQATLVGLNVISNATQANVTGAKNWAAVKKADDDVIVEATTNPNDESAWERISWSGDCGTAVPDKPNQRTLSRADSKKYHVEAELGGESDYVDVWILWARVTILTQGKTPKKAVQFGRRYDRTERLGARAFDRGKRAVGKVVPVARIEPAGIHRVVERGWAFKRERMTHDWNDGAKDNPGETSNDYWNTSWVDDTSDAAFQKVKPNSKGKIFDRDAPNIGAFGIDNAETYNNFRQWVEWNGDVCSDKAGWYWKGRWEKSESPRVTLKEVGTGNITLPDESQFNP